jgi:hypothetical protein
MLNEPEAVVDTTHGFKSDCAAHPLISAATILEDNFIFLLALTRWFLVKIIYVGVKNWGELENSLMHLPMK